MNFLLVGIFIVALSAGISLLLFRKKQRKAEDVVRDLLRPDQEITAAIVPTQVERVFKEKITELQLSPQYASAIKKKSLIISFIIGATISGLMLGFRFSFDHLLVIGSFIFLGVIVGRRKAAEGDPRYLERLEFHLPLTMEQVVMGVQAGLDVIPALQRAVPEKTKAFEANPVYELIRIVLRLTEGGMSLRQALTIVAEQIESSALRHAFIHLGVAYEEGGELIEALRELSDATQRYFEETVEETINTMPVKATLPLVCTFAGLILIFLTGPMVQLSQFSKHQTQSLSEVVSE